MITFEQIACLYLYVPNYQAIVTTVAVKRFIINRLKINWLYLFMYVSVIIVPHMIPAIHA